MASGSDPGKGGVRRKAEEAEAAGMRSTGEGGLEGAWLRETQKVPLSRLAARHRLLHTPRPRMTAFWKVILGVICGKAFLFPHHYQLREGSLA